MTTTTPALILPPLRGRKKKAKDETLNRVQGDGKGRKKLWL